MGFKDMLQRKFEKKNKFKEMEEEHLALKRIEEKDKSPEERELDKRFAEKRRHEAGKILQKLKAEDERKVFGSGLTKVNKINITKQPHINVLSGFNIKSRKKVLNKFGLL
jgi:hypothetical protein